MWMSHNFLKLNDKNNDSCDSEADHVGRIQNCYKEIKMWMSHNFLKLNDKNVFMFVFGTTVLLS